MTAPGLTPKQLDSVFPFHLVIDREGEITHAGSALSRIAPELRPGTPWYSGLTAMRPLLPAQPSFEKLQQLQRSLFILRCRSRELMLRGQFIASSETGSGTFLVSPWITRIDQTIELGLSLSDFPNHDVVGEFLVLLQAKETALADAEALTARLREQRAQLREANAQLASQIAAREQVEDALEQRDASYREAIAHIREVVFQTDAEGLWTFLNPAWVEITGFELSESLGRPFFEFLHPDDVETNRLRFEPLIRREKEVCQHEIRYRTRDGGFKWVEVHARLVIGAKGEIAGTAGTLRDVTSHHEAAELRENARITAEHASRQMSEFVANMSHEVRTPLNGVMGLMAALRSTRLSADQRELVDTAYQSGQLLLAIVNDLLDLSKIEAGKLAIERVPLKLQSVIAQALEGPGSQALQKGLKFDIAFAANTPLTVISDPVRLRQLVLNLADNAVKFTRHGSISVAVAVVDRPRGERLRVSVTDTGVGIPPSKLGSIFDKFTQVDSSTTRHYGGTGLGLAICRKLALLMGGDIGVDSRQGHGSTFWFEIALERGEADAVVDSAPRAMPRFDAVKAPRVLVAEDNLTNQLVVRLFLEAVGCSVECVANGRDAVAKVMGSHYDVVLMDGQMPELDGYEATRQIRKLPGVAHLPIIAMTASAMVGDRERCLAAGMTDYLAKPLQEAELAAALARALGRSATDVAQESPVGDAADAEFEPATILQIFSNPADAETFAECLIKDLKRGQNTLRESLALGDRDSAARAAHSIAGAAAQARAHRITSLARATEHRLRSGNQSDGALASARQLGDHAGSLAAVLAEWCRKRRRLPAADSGGPTVKGPADSPARI